MPTARVNAVDHVSDKDGDNVWEVITDYDNPGPDKRNLCAFYIPFDGPKPDIGATITWGDQFLRGGWCDWGQGKVKRVGFVHDPADPALYTR